MCALPTLAQSPVWRISCARKKVMYANFRGRHLSDSAMRRSRMVWTPQEPYYDDLFELLDGVYVKIQQPGAYLIAVRIARHGACAPYLDVNGKEHSDFAGPAAPEGAEAVVASGDALLTTLVLLR